MPKNKPLRLVVDTNLWISFLISDRQRRLDSLLYLEKVRFLFSAELLEEINRAATKIEEIFCCKCIGSNAYKSGAFYRHY